MKIIIDKEFKNLIPPLESEELSQLKSSIKEEGCRDPITLWNGVIVDGHNRYEICSNSNFKFKIINKKFKDRNEAIVWMINNQLSRRNISKYNRIKLELKKEYILKPIAKENQIRKPNSVYQNSDKQNSDKAVHVLKEIAKQSKVSHDTVQRVKFIEGRADQKTKDKLSRGEETINKVYTILKRREKVKEIKKELAKPTLDKNKKYEIIYADPAWDYSKKIGEGIAGEQYNLSSLEEMKKIPVNDITEENAVLFMWVTHPMLKEGLELLESWGFRYKTCGFNWIKLNKNGKPFFGIGHYTKSNSELCLLAIKGKGLPILDNTISQIIMTEKSIHSKKPQEVRDKIVQLIGNRKRIELFSRDNPEGWDVYGDEVR